MAIIDYNEWTLRQNNYSDVIDEIRKEKMPHWGSFLYHVSIPGKDSDGRKNLFRFDIRQLFCESFCVSSDLDYSFYERARENATKPKELIEKKRHYTSCVYDKVASFILSLEETPLVVFEHSNISFWSEIDSFHFDYLRQLLIENGIMFVDSLSLDKYLKNISLPIVIVELISNNDRMLFNCESILKSIQTPNTISYISILKEYERDEMLFLINEEKEKLLASTSASVAITKEAAKGKSTNYPSDYDKLKVEFDTPKDNYAAYQQILNDNGITYLYHFTDRRNLSSIKEYGGLYSWKYCELHGIHIPYPGGDNNSRLLDASFKLENYVRLSFCEDHPMSWRLQQQGYDLVLLKIKVDVAWSQNALYSDINAADPRHVHGGSLENLKSIDFSATKQHYVSRESPFFKKHQAEVMIKTFIPVDCIVNFDNPDTI